MAGYFDRDSNLVGFLTIKSGNNFDDPLSIHPKLHPQVYR